MPDIRTPAIVYAQLRERLIALHPSLAEDDQALMDTLDGETAFADVAVELYESMRRDEFMAEATKARRDELAERQARFENRADAKRRALAQAMQDAERDKIEAPSVTLSLRRGAVTLLITDEKAIPPGYMVTKTTSTPDKANIKAALQLGEAIPGCALSNGGMTLSTRAK